MCEPAIGLAGYALRHQLAPSSLGTLDQRGKQWLCSPPYGQRARAKASPHRLLNLATLLNIPVEAEEHRAHRVAERLS